LKPKNVIRDKNKSELYDVNNSYEESIAEQPDKLDVLIETTEYDVDYIDEDEDESLLEDSNHEDDFFLSGLKV